MLATLLAACLFFPAEASAADNGMPSDYAPPIYNAIPAQQFKDVFETETIEISGVEVIPDHGINTFTETIHFRIFNSTTQETEYEVDTTNDGLGRHTLPTLKLKKNHNYIFFVEDPWFQLGTKKYVQILDADAKMASEGAGAYDYKYIVKDSEGIEQYNKEYKKLTEINVYKRASECEDPREDARCCIGCTNIPVVVTYNGEPVQEKLKFKFISEVETVNGSTNYLPEGRGILYANLLEDITYMVYLDSDKYVMDPFPVVVKDKSEYGEGRYAYNHTTCFRVDGEYPLKLFDAGKTSFEDLYNCNTTVTSLMKRVTVSGMSFRHLLILDRVLDKSVAPAEMKGKDYEVISITAVNPHRWEISKLCGTDFTIRKKISHDKLVKNVSYIDKQGKLRSLNFDQNSADEVSFTMDSLSLYPVVIEFDPTATYSLYKASTDEKAEDPAAGDDTAETKTGTKKVKTVTVNVKTVSAKAVSKAVKKAGGTSKSVTKIILGKKVRKISPKAFAKYRKLTTLEVRTKKLKKKSVKNALKGSKVRIVKIKVGKKALNKKYVKKYKKIFTKKNAGRKVTVKR